MQDSTKVVLAGTMSSVKECENFPVDPANFPAGLCVVLANTGLPSLAIGDGMRIGVSRGRSLADVKQTSIQRTGLRVPVCAALKRSTGVITVTNVSNLLTGTADTLTVGSTVFTFVASSPGADEIEASGSTANTATNIAAEINGHATAGLLVYAVASGAAVTLYSKIEGAATGHDVALAYADLGTATVGITLSGLSDGKLTGGSNTISSIAYAVKGQKMYTNDVTGKADIAMVGFTTITDAIYVDGAKTGIAEDGSEVGAVLVDMAGGL